MEIVGLLLDKEDHSKLPPTDAAGNTLLHMTIIGNHSMVKEVLEKMKSLGYSEQLQGLVNLVNKVNCY